MAALPDSPVMGFEDREPEVLTDAQIDELLQEAEDRLRQKAGLPPNIDNRTLSLSAVVAPSATKIHLSKLEHNLDRSSYIKNHNGVAKTNPSLMVPIEQRKMADGLRTLDTQQTSGKKINDQVDAGPDWFHLPKTEVTTQLKRDLQLIEMRNVLDPHRHYKKNTRKGKIPTFSQVGTVIEGPTEWYSARLNRKDRSKNFVEEEMRNEQQTGRFKRKYDEIQDAKTSGKKAHYKKVLASRKKKRT